MAKQPQFRQMKRDKDKLSKLNTAFRRKARRLDKMFDVDLTQDYQVKYIDDFKSRKEFNQYIKQMEKATEYSSHRYVKNKHGMVVEREVYQKYKKVLPKVAKQQRQMLDNLKEHLKANFGYEPNLDQLRSMGDERFDRFLEPSFRFDNYSNPEFFKRHLENLQKKLDPSYYYQGDRRLKANMLQGIENGLGMNIGGQLYNKIDRMSIADFRDFYYTQELEMIRYVYSLTEATQIEADMQTRLARFEEIRGK